MGYAAQEGKATAIEVLQFLEPKPRHFLDVGTGAGSWLEAVKPWFLDSFWIAIEVWEPYIHQFCLQERYSLVHRGDARTVPFHEVDVVILGDILEHMSKDEAILVWKKARVAARQAVILSIPVIKYPQGHVHGNPYQQHVKEDWTDDEVKDTFPDPAVAEVFSTIGLYVWLT